MKTLERLENQIDRAYAGYINLSQIEAKEVAVNFFNREQFYETKLIQIAEGNWLLHKGDWLMLSQPFEYSINDLFVLREEVDKLRTKYPDLFKPATESIVKVHKIEHEVEAEIQHPTGGAPKSSLTEAVECAFYELLGNGNTRTIEPGRVLEFLQYLKDCVTEGNPNFSDYVSERIKDVKKVTTDCTIVMQVRTQKEKVEFLDTRKNKTYKSGDVSKILTKLRKK